jgi:hypothetical protein
MFMSSDNLQDLLAKRIFQEPSIEIEETWTHGAILGGILYNVQTTLSVADAFKLAGDMLIDKVLSSDIEGYEIVYPVLYNYRHCLELYLKAIVKVEKGHDLSKLLEKLKEYVQTHYQTNLPPWFENWILEFDEFDNRSDMFRYADKCLESRHTKDMGEFWIDFIALRRIIALYQEAFHQLAEKQMFS